MASTCRDILLEVKRRLGDTNAPVPGEVDSMAYLNNAIRGIWNHGARMRSPILQKIIRVTEPHGFTGQVDDGFFSVLSVYDHDSGRYLGVIDSENFHRDSMGERRKFRALNNTIEIYPMSGDGGFDVSVCYIPESTTLKSRDEEIPFPQRMDDVVVQWVVSLITTEVNSASDVELAQIPYGNTMSEYFRGTTPRLLSGSFPW